MRLHTSCLRQLFRFVTAVTDLPKVDRLLKTQLCVGTDLSLDYISNGNEELMRATRLGLASHHFTCNNFFGITFMPPGISQL